MPDPTPDRIHRIPLTKIDDAVLARDRNGPGLTIRRERTRDGYALHFTGREADSGLLDAVFDEIARLFGPG